MGHWLRSASSLRLGGCSGGRLVLEETWCKGEDKIESVIKLREAVQVMSGSDCRGLEATVPGYVDVLQACIKLKALEEGRKVEAHIMKSRFASSLVLGNFLIRMFAKCGSVEDARRVMDRLPEQDPFSWTAVISACVKQGELREAIKLYHRMKAMGMQPNKYTFVSVLKGCGGARELKEGRQLEDDIVRNGYDADIVVSSALIDMYLKCGSLKDAQERFDQMKERDAATWGAMISAYVRYGFRKESLHLYAQMRRALVKPERVTLVSILKAASSLGAVEHGKQVHADILHYKYELDVFLGSALVDMYAKCGVVKAARLVFDNLRDRDLVVWTAMISGYAKQGSGEAALKVFADMGKAGVRPNGYTYVGVLQACTSLSALEQGKLIHAEVVQQGYEADVYVGNALLDMYAKCGSMDDSMATFSRMSKRDVISWNVILSGFTHQLLGKDALELYNVMKHGSTKANDVTYLVLLKACASLRDLERGRAIHADVVQSGTELSVSLGNTLIDMYAKCGSLAEARQVFDDLGHKDVVSWNVMLAGYVQQGHFGQALQVFDEMQETGGMLNSYCLISALKACAGLAAMEQGMEVHNRILGMEIHVDALLGSALVDMYAKCGSIENARQVFDGLPDRSVVLYTAMIGGYAQHGLAKEGVELFEQMHQQGVKPDGVTLLCILRGCSHAGLVEDGVRYFQSMAEVHGISPAAEHFACMVDLLGRAGRLQEAQDLISKMPMPPCAVVWSSLLAACRHHGNMSLGELAFQRLVELEPTNAGAYATIASMFAACERWNDVDRMRKLMEEAGVGREAGCSWTEVGKRVHTFGVRDGAHPQSEKIFAELSRLTRRMKATAGYVPCHSSVPHAVGEERKELALCGHSEKLALVFGLMNTRAGAPIRIVKNLRVCQDCHNFAKIVSKLACREIIHRDASRFHHFKDGHCSCQDYW